MKRSAIPASRGDCFSGDAPFSLTEAAQRRADMAVESRRLDLTHVLRALANFDTRGFVTLVAEADSGRLVGCQLLPPMPARSSRQQRWPSASV